MTGGENMRRVMEASGVYKLTGNSPLDWELDACTAGLKTVWDRAEALEKELFLQTAGAETLENWELLFRPQACSSATLEERRQALVKAMRPYPGPASLEVIESLAEACGVKAKAQEAQGKLLLQGEKLIGVTEKEARRMLERVLPSHLEWELTFPESE